MITFLDIRNLGNQRMTRKALLAMKYIRLYNVLKVTFARPSATGDIYGRSRSKILLSAIDSCEGVEGQNVVELLQKSIKKRGDIRVDVAAILNDTTGCLMSCAWKNPKCRIGLIIGTGTNACYLEDLDKVQKTENFI